LAEATIQRGARTSDFCCEPVATSGLASLARAKPGAGSSSVDPANRITANKLREERIGGRRRVLKIILLGNISGIILHKEHSNGLDFPPFAPILIDIIAGTRHG
jgi:hypothetical protein